MQQVGGAILYISFNTELVSLVRASRSNGGNGWVPVHTVQKV